jgi:hypothetical protein
VFFLYILFKETAHRERSIERQNESEAIQSQHRLSISSEPVQAHYENNNNNNNTSNLNSNSILLLLFILILSLVFVLDLY